MKKNAIITGGNSGIGYETAKLFVENNYDVTILCRDEEKAKKTADDINVDYLICDLANPEELQGKLEKFTDGLDVLINNAANPALMPFDLIDYMAFEAAFKTNVYAPIYLSRTLAPALQKRKGCVVNISSIIVENGKPNLCLYAATKGALEAMSRSLAIEFAPKNIRVNIVSPGAIDTPIIDKLGIPADQIAMLKKSQAEAIPLKRYGMPAEVAKVVLSQAESEYVTGSNWIVDGGVDAG